MISKASQCAIAVTLILLFPVLSAPARSSRSAPERIAVAGDTEYVHDPSIMKDADTWYLFGTASGPNHKGELPVRCSRDLHEWKLCGAVFDQIPDWITKLSPQTKELWAPDISYFNGEYHLYYAFSVFGKNTSGIALLTNKTLDPHSPNFHWEDRGLVLQSRLEDDYNAIDPNLVLDRKGNAWVAFGSFWSGIKMRAIDSKTGQLFESDSKLYSLARRKRPVNPPPNPPGLPGDWQAVEAPFIVQHRDYFYLFVSFDLCCRGTKSNYKTMVGRSHDVTGPYVDSDGTPMMDGGGTPVLLGNSRWIGPGGESVGQEKDGDIMVFHAYDGKTGHPHLQVSTIDWTGGWPHVALEGGNPANH
ncbi:MAG: arabinan endo-1,5-alpha-L-arabinosidase [Acidobacteria bacterium]|nr:MAG: arabinan endo-1,5-alpha-L-arabinosidase [Acidobacteriota bacterium]